MGANVTINLQLSSIKQYAPSGQPTFLDEFGRANAPSGNSATWASGTGNGQANQVWRGNDAGGFSIASGGTLTINLKGANGELDALNKALNLTAVAGLYFELDNPGPGNRVVLGINGNGCVANLGFGNLSNMGIYGPTLLTAPNGNGWPITSGAANVIITNPSAVTISGKPRIWGPGA